MPLITDTIMCFICPDLIITTHCYCNMLQESHFAKACGLLECALIAALASIKWLKVLVLMTF